MIIRRSLILRLSCCLFPLLLASCFESITTPEIHSQDLAVLSGITGLYQWGDPDEEQRITYAYVKAGTDKRYAVSSWYVSSKGKIFGYEDYVIAIVPLQVPQREQYLALVMRPGKAGAYFGHLQKDKNDFAFGLINIDKEKGADPSFQAALSSRGFAGNSTHIWGAVSSTTLKQLFSDQNFRNSLTIAPQTLRRIAPKDWKQIPIPNTVVENLSGITVEEFPQLPAAEKGDANAQYSLGRFFSSRDTGVNDIAQARYWFGRAARQGHTDAQNELGILYLNAKDYNQARYWYEPAARQGNAYAQSNLGWLYENGLGVPQDHSLARQLYQNAANSGSTYGQYRLGIFYASGQGGPQDLTIARRLFRQAADAQKDAAFRHGEMCARGEGGRQDFAEARVWFYKAAEQGHVDAQADLAGLYYDGKGGEQDYSAARYWYRQAADQNHVQSQVDLATMYGSGQGGKQDYVQARLWFQDAARQGHAEAQYALGLHYMLGKGVSEDQEKGLDLIQRAAKNGSRRAKSYLEGP